MIVAETYKYIVGPYTVQSRPRFDNPAWAVYIIYRGEHFVGKSFSRPDLGCCEWLERGIYAEPSVPLIHGYTAITAKRRGRPRKVDAERELQEAMST